MIVHQTILLWISNSNRKTCQTVGASSAELVSGHTTISEEAVNSDEIMSPYLTHVTFWGF